jgi:hypothetical protein
MCPDRSEPLQLRQILKATSPSAGPRAVGAILARAQLLADINRALRDWCNEPWIRHVRLANLRGDTVVVYVASAPALIPLRSRASDLLAWLEARFRLGCTRLETKVRPPVPDTATRVYRSARVQRKPSG